MKQDRYILLGLCIVLFLLIIHLISARTFAAPICPPNHDGMPSSSGCPNCGAKPPGIDVPINTDTNRPPDDQIPEPPREPDRASQLARADCSRWPGTEPRWNERTNRVDCFCIQGMAWNRDHTACVDERQAAVEKADCSQWRGTEPQWNDRTNRVDCFCVQGKSWNRDHTACIDERQAALEKADCSRWPGSIPQWNNQTNRADCFCPQGTVWNRDRTRCIDARQAAVENMDCSRWPGSIPQWNNQTNRADCFCPQGMVWNKDRTACISAHQQQEQDRCQRLGSALTIARDRKDINQFRMLLAQARDCGFYQQALADLRRMEQELAPPKPQPPPQPPVLDLSIAGTWSIQGIALLRIVQQRDDYTGYLAQTLPNLSSVVRAGEVILKLKRIRGNQYKGQLLDKLFETKNEKIIKTKWVEAQLTALSQNEIQIDMVDIAGKKISFKLIRVK